MSQTGANDLSFDDLEQLLSSDDLEWLIQQKCKEQQLDAARSLLKTRLEHLLEQLRQLEQSIQDEQTKEQLDTLEELRDALALRFHNNMHKLKEIMTELNNNKLEMEERQRQIYDQLMQSVTSEQNDLASN